MKRFIPVILAGVLVGGTALSADDSADSVVAYRKAIMGEAGKHMKAANMIAKGEIHRPQDLVAHAEALKAAGADFASLFPEGTGPDKVSKTEAKAEIWTKKDDFAAAAKAFADETAKLADVAKTGDLVAAQAQLSKVGDTCGHCHDSFKAKD